jgi:hypothetical protein
MPEPPKATELKARRHDAGVWRLQAFGVRSKAKLELGALTRRPSAASNAWQRFSQSTTDDGTWQRSTWRLPGCEGFRPVTKLARRRLELPLTERWPPKNGQPTPKRARLSHGINASRLRH